MPADRTVREVRPVARELAPADRNMRDVPVRAGRADLRAELDDVRERMCRLGLGFREIAAEIGRRYRLRPREAYRLAWGWTPEHAAAQFNALAAGAGLQPPGSLTGSQLREHEHWPAGGRKPPVRVLLLLAQMYQTDVGCLLDLADHENLAPPDRVTLIQPPQPGQTPFGIKLAALIEERGHSLREVAHRAGYSAGYLSNIIYGRKRATEQIASLLDDLLEASGELAALALTAGRDSKPAARRNRHHGQGRAMPIITTGAGGVSLSLPQIPCRVVIEISGSDTGIMQLAADSEDCGPISGRLALIRDTGSSRTGRTQATRE